MTQEETIAKIKAEIERLKSAVDKTIKDLGMLKPSLYIRGELNAYEEILDFLDTIEESGDGLEIVKEARIIPGMLSNFGTSYFVIDVELSQEEQSNLHLAPGFGSCGVKIKIVCE